MTLQSGSHERAVMMYRLVVRVPYKDVAGTKRTASFGGHLFKYPVCRAIKKHKSPYGGMHVRVATLDFPEFLMDAGRDLTTDYD